MKKRLGLLLALLFFIGISGGFLLQTVYQKRLDNALLAAIQQSDESAVRAALKGGANPNIHDIPYEEHLSVIEQCQQIMKRLFHHSAETGIQDTAFVLYYSKSRERFDPTLLKLFLDHGAAPNATDSFFGNPALMYIAMGHQPQTLSFLIQHGGNIHQKNKAGFTPLHYAAMYGDAQTIAVLLGAGAEIDAPNDIGQTPLHRACWNDNIETARVLLQYHAKVNLLDEGNETPLDGAQGRCKAEMLALLKQNGAKTAEELDAESTRGDKP